MNFSDKKLEGQDVEFLHEKITSISIQCTMGIYYFPFDSQECTFSLQLLGYLIQDSLWDEDNIDIYMTPGLEVALFSDLQFTGVRSQPDVVRITM